MPGRHRMAHHRPALRLTAAELDEALRTQSLAQAAADVSLLAPSDIHPRNKAGTVPAPASCYNALKVRLLDTEQLQHLCAKIQPIDAEHCQEDAAATPKRAVANQDNTLPRVRPRGIQLDVAFRYGVFSAPTDQPKRSISWEKTHILAAAAGNYPATSEHEISHLCHNPHCIKPSHLLWELHPANVERESCRYTRRLECPACSHSFSLCKHAPACTA
jgi:hypothetical protein